MADDASHAQGIEEFLDHIYAIDREVRLNERFDPGAAEPCNPGAKQPGAFIFDFGDIRSLLANWGYVQSAMRPEDRRVGKECVSTCRSRGSSSHYTKTAHLPNTTHPHSTTLPLSTHPYSSPQP